MAEKERQSASRESKATGSSSPAATESLTVLSREERLACWDSRDAYYHCKATHGPEACTAERAAFERLCPAAWVRHFERRHLFDAYKAKLLTEGAVVKEDIKSG